MKLKMAENSLFAILMRSPWWMSFGIAAGLVGLALRRRFRLRGRTTGMFVAAPFVVTGAIAALRQFRAPSAARVERTLNAIRAMSWNDFAAGDRVCAARRGLRGDAGSIAAKRTSRRGRRRAPRSSDASASRSRAPASSRFRIFTPRWAHAKPTMRSTSPPAKSPIRRGSSPRGTASASCRVPISWPGSRLRVAAVCGRPDARAVGCVANAAVARCRACGGRRRCWSSRRSSRSERHWPSFARPRLIGAVIAAVHHAEVVAHRTGEPFGTLVLAVAITVIEVALIVSIMLAGGADKASLPRDTIFAAVMIICNGVVGLCLLGRRPAPSRAIVPHRRGEHGPCRVDRAEHALARAADVHDQRAWPDVHGVATRVRGDRIAHALGRVRVRADGATSRLLPSAVESANEDVHAQPPSNRRALASFGLLLVSLVAVVGLAKALSPSIERAVAAAGAPKAIIGVAIALLVLLPETWAAIRAARANRIQTSLNLALRLGAREHRPDDSRRRGRSRVARRFRWSSGSRPRTWCCSRSPSW